MGKDIGEAIIRPLKNSLDDMPVHVRQLAEMFRKHGKKQKDNDSEITDLDNTEVPQPLRDGWRRDGDTPNSVVGDRHGTRPDPSEYLDQSYIDQHLARFENGASRIYVSGSLHQWGPGQADHTTFVFPTDELQTILDETGGDAQQLALRLGMDADFYLDSDGNPLPVEIRNFTPDELSGLRMPSGNEGGANPKWIPGGYLPTGIPEAVIDVPESATGYGNLDTGGTDYNHGLWPGTGQGLTLTNNAND